MPDLRRISALAVLTVVLTVVLAGCSGGGPSSDDASATPSATATPAPTPAPTPSATPSQTPPPSATEARRPKKGACHRVSFDDAVAPTAALASVPCSKAHTSETYAVGTVANLVDGHLLAIDSERVQRQVATTCPDALSAAAGGTPSDLRLSMLRSVWFTPTVAQSDAGADWYRCDVVALAGSDQLTRVTTSLVGVLDTPEGREAYGMCGTAGPDDSDFERVPCGEQHSWRAFSVVTLPNGDYPGRAAIASAGEAPCKDGASDIADDPLDYEWAFEGPDRDQWEAGQTFLRCWTPG